MKKNSILFLIASERGIGGSLVIEFWRMALWSGLLEEGFVIETKKGGTAEAQSFVPIEGWRSFFVLYKERLIGFMFLNNF